MSFMSNINRVPELLEQIEQKNNELTSLVNQLKQIKQEINAAKNTVESKYNEIKQLIDLTASEQNKGIVKLATIDLASNKDSDVITYKILKNLIENITDYIPSATSEKAGIVKLAKKIDNNENEQDSILTGVLTENDIKKIKEFEEKQKQLVIGVYNGLNYSIHSITDTDKIINISGILPVITNNNTVIRFPFSIYRDTLGISVNPIMTENNSKSIARIQKISADSFEFIVDHEKNNINIDVSINIQGCIINSNKPMNKIKTTKTGNIIKISLED